ncbi:MAG: Fic family protein [Rhodothermia bacterium]
MKRTSQGHYVEVATAGESFRAFVPAHLPPDPPVQWSPGLRYRFDEALLALGRLDNLADGLEDPGPLLYNFVRKEAVLSSMIEGTQSSLADLMLHEVDGEPGVPVEDVKEVSQYVSALEHGLERLRSGFPLSLRLIREIHKILLSHGRGANKEPGEFRRSQVWIGGTRPGNAVFVPPPAHLVPKSMGEFEGFLHEPPTSVSPLLKAGLAHVQFETIHPFLDGNGRIGRLLITLLLSEQDVLKQPLLFVSLYFKTHRQTYYELLDRVRTNGDWETWLEFFAEAVTTGADEARTSINQILAVFSEDRLKIAGLGRASESALAVHNSFGRRPISTADSLSDSTGLSAPTVNKTLVHLEDLGIVDELTGRQRDRVFGYRRYLDILNRDTDLI